jgi:hypothetical protein
MDSIMPIARALTVWLLIIVAETVHGVLRGLFLVPVVGDLRARQIGVAIGSLIILAVAAATIRWLGAKTRSELLAVGAVWLALTLAFEFLFGRYVAGASWDRLLSDYDPTRGGFLGLGMLVLALSPLIAAKLRGLPTASA